MAYLTSTDLIGAVVIRRGESLIANLPTGAKFTFERHDHLSWYVAFADGDGYYVADDRLIQILETRWHSLSPALTMNRCTGDRR